MFTLTGYAVCFQYLAEQLQRAYIGCHAGSGNLQLLPDLQKVHWRRYGCLYGPRKHACALVQMGPTLPGLKRAEAM